MEERITIYVIPSVIDYLDELVFKLYQNEYFGFVESAENYVEKIYDSIPQLIINKPHKISPPELQKNGKFYIAYSSNKRTTWYIFFNKRAHRYLIKFITNNHVPNAQFLQS